MSSKSDFNILIVEDSAITSFHIQLLLEDKGFHIQKLNNGQDAIELAKKEVIQLILMDIMLNGPLTGLDTAQSIREFSEVPIIFVSALTDAKTLEVIENITNSKKITKPFEESILMEAIEELSK